MPYPFRKFGFRVKLGVAAAALIFGFATILAVNAQAQTYKVIYNFNGGQDGSHPAAGLTMDAAGNLYGTTEQGGSAGQGTVFKLSNKGSGWVLSPLYSFQGGSDGAEPIARVVFGPDGSLYGTTQAGGNNGCYAGRGCGTVLNLKPPPTRPANALSPWLETVLYTFTGGADGGTPQSADLIFDHAGNLYGTARGGGLAGCNGNGCGVVYKLTPSGGSWTESVLYSFTGGNDGASPDGGVTFQAGNLYGLATAGGSVGRGTVYELMPSGQSWIEKVLYDFNSGSSGVSPRGTPVFDASGNLFFSTNTDTFHSSGTVYELSQSGGNWTLTELVPLSHQFVSGGVVLDASDNVYGTAVGDGRNTFGTIFMLTGTTEKVLHSSRSDCSDGCDPEGGVIIDAKGNLYGTASTGGAHGQGVVWEITP